MSAEEKRTSLARNLAWFGLLGLTALWARTPRAQAVAAAAGAASADIEDDHAGSTPAREGDDRGPGEEHPGDAEGTSGLKGYTIGLGLALVLTLISFGLPATGLVWGPAVPVALIVFALAQIGIHLVFFLHLTTGPDNTNNALALAFGVLIVTLLIGGSLWIMWHLNHNMMSMGATMDMAR